MKSITPLSNKRVAIISCAWAVLAVAYVLLAEPYGSRMSDSEWEEFGRLLLIPPIAIFVLNILLEKFIKDND